MKRYKKISVTGLTIAVILFCAFLPSGIATLTDAFEDHRISYGTQKNVSLIRELNGIEKIYLLKSGIPVAGAGERTNLGSYDMMEVVENALSEYYNCGYIESEIADFTIVECEPFLYYSNEISNLSGIFWQIYMESDNAYAESISMYLDDQTGKVMLLSYESHEEIYSGQSLSERLYGLYSLYESQQGWMMEKNGEQQEYLHKQEMTCRLGSKLYGEIEICFTMTTSGYSIYLNSGESDAIQMQK